MKKLGVIPTPFSTYVYFHGEKMKHYGEARVEQMFALRSFLNAGVRATQASDYPPGPYEPMMALQSSVTRTDISGKTWGASQRITVEEAIRVGTMHGAYASFEEDRKGSLEAGKLADLVVLGRDPLTEDPSTLISIPIQRNPARDDAIARRARKNVHDLVLGTRHQAEELGDPGLECRASPDLAAARVDHVILRHQLVDGVDVVSGAPDAAEEIAGELLGGGDGIVRHVTAPSKRRVRSRRCRPPRESPLPGGSGGPWFRPEGSSRAPAPG